MKFSKVSLRHLLLSVLVFCLVYISGCDPAKSGGGTSRDSTQGGGTPSMKATDTAKKPIDTTKLK